MTPSNRPPYWRTLLVLGRTSNLPTVWSNCLAGWLLGGGGSLERLGLVCLGATLLYLGGMFLNDAFDADFDEVHRQERPVPSGAIHVDEVWRWGFTLLGAGLIVLILIGTVTGVLAALLLGCIVVYDAVHKLTGFSPVLMAGCRLLLYLVAASTGLHGVTGLSIWSAIALAVYVTGLSNLARRESTRGGINHWPCWLLAAPIVLALVANGPGHRFKAVVLSAVLGLWILFSLRHSLGLREPRIGRTVSLLLAGIALVDLVATGGGETIGVTLTFLGLFAAALLAQRFVPAT